MKLLFTLVLFAACTFVALGQQTDYTYQAVPFTKVKFTDQFWLPRIKTNHTVTIPASFERCENTGRVKNFEMAAARSGKFCTVYPFDDTDIYKTIEGASFSMSLYPDSKLDAYIDELIVKIKNAQEPDGYLYTARTINPLAVHNWAGKERWEKEREMSHELYNSGHLYEAAAAHYQATGKRNLLDIAVKNADLVCSVFGPEGKHVAPGHEVVEMGLVKLYRITGKKEYLATAKFFVDQRGHYDGYNAADENPFKNGSYWQDNIPVVEQTEALGHAVRAGYLYAAVADIAALTGDKDYLNAIDKIWENVVTKKIYVQGGVGAVGDGERFGENYELPNATAYNETCAAIANVYWNHRMFLLHGESKYIDVLEKTLYNGLLSGVGMDGKSFFYTNAMEIRTSFAHGDREVTRSGWFTCSCCPTNVTRLIPSIPGYVYATRDNSIYANLFVTSAADIAVAGTTVSLAQTNNYPWEGNLTFKVDPKKAASFDLRIRIPGWAQGEAMPSDLYRFVNKTGTAVSISLNGKPVEYEMQQGYAVLSRKWKKGDVVTVVLPMDVKHVVANAMVKDDHNKVSLQRGPLTYCAEGIDNAGKTSNILLTEAVKLIPEFKPALLNGVTVLNGEATVVVIESNGTRVSTVQQPFVAIPYYAWAHRASKEMAVWFPTKITNLDIYATDQ